MLCIACHFYKGNILSTFNIWQKDHSNSGNVISIEPNGLLITSKASNMMVNGFICQRDSQEKSSTNS